MGGKRRTEEEVVLSYFKSAPIDAAKALLNVAKAELKQRVEALKPPQLHPTRKAKSSTRNKSAAPTPPVTGAAQEAGAA